MVASAQPPLRTLADMSDEERALLASPYGFGKHVLGLPIYDRPGLRKIGSCGADGAEYYPIFENDLQKQVVNAMDADRPRVSVRTANGAGKTTTLIPTAVLWLMTMHPRAKVVMTSGVERQVRGQLFPALKAHKNKLGGWKFNDADIEAPNGSMAIGFSTNDGGRFEGWHGNKNPLYDLLKHDGPLMIIVDEAKSVAPTIFEAIDRCTYQALLMASSCGGSAGDFYKSHTTDARFFRTFQIASCHCPHADHDKNRDLILKRGIDDPLVRSKVFAEFMSGEAGAVVAMEAVRALIAQPPAKIRGARRIFLDFAAGGDENAIAHRDGNVARIEAAWREKNTMTACAQFIGHLRRLGVTPHNCPEIVAGDGDGLGKVMLDRMAELGWHIQRVHNGAAARDPGYYNRGAEIWHTGAKKISEKAVVLEDLDEATIEQLTSRIGYADPKGKLRVEPKEDMRARGLDSPDRADALLGCLEDMDAVQPRAFTGTAPDQNLGLLEQIIEQQGGVGLPGCFAG
jgi:hypothetical protein